MQAAGAAAPCHEVRSARWWCEGELDDPVITSPKPKPPTGGLALVGRLHRTPLGPGLDGPGNGAGGAAALRLGPRLV